MRVGGGNDPGIDAHDLRAAQALQFFLLQKTKQFGLEAQRHLADFVEEERASLRRLDSSRVGLHGASESAAGVSKKFGFKQGLGNGGAIHNRKGTPGARAQLMNGPGYDFFPAAGWARDEHGGVARREQSCQPITGCMMRGVADHSR